MQRPTLDMWALPTTSTPSPLPSCFDSSQTLVYVWFTAKRNALWISLLFNLSQRPLKTGSNALISYSEERLIYRYACHLLLLVFLNKAWRYRWCLDQSYRGLYLEMLAFLKIYLFIYLFNIFKIFYWKGAQCCKWLQHISSNENNHGLWWCWRDPLPPPSTQVTGNQTGSRAGCKQSCEVCSVRRV